jgi:hypothetical protein
MSTDLARLERWMQREIARPSQASSRVEREIAPSGQLSSAERLSIYVDLVRTRLVECLRSDFRAVEHALGRREFERIASLYAAQLPTRHYSLNRLGAGFPRFLRDAAPRAARRAFVADLAELERAVEEVFDASRDELLGPAELLAIPPARRPGLRLKPIRALRLIESRFAVDAYLEAVSAGRRARVVRRTTFTLVWRRDLEVRRRVLERSEAAALAAMLRGDSIAALVRRSTTPAEHVVAWFHAWSSAGLFATSRPRR